LKAHYPAEFMAAVLSSDMDNTDKIVLFLEECKSLGLEVLPPNINGSSYQFIAEKIKISHGLGAIKGVGEAAIENIVAERKVNGEFKDLFDFCRRVDLRKVNKRVLEALIKAGAMDDLGPSRATMFASIPAATKAAEQHSFNHTMGQNDLFGATIEQDDHYAHAFAKAKPWSDKERLRNEKDTLGVYISGHPLDQYEQELSSFTTCKIDELQHLNNKAVRIAGLLTAIRMMNTKRGERMAFVRLTDLTGSIEVAVFSDVYHSSRHLLEKDRLVVIEGEVGVDKYTGGFKTSANRLMDIEKAREIYSKYLLIKMDDDDKNLPEKIGQLTGVLSGHQGKSLVCVEYMQKGIKALLPLGDKWRVLPSDNLIEKLQKMFSAANVGVMYNPKNGS
jgi:DNA polymerase III subunit alpha